MTTQERMNEHFADATYLCPQSRIIALCLAGSQNYGIDTQDSDVDTKLIVAPNLLDITYLCKPDSKTFEKENNEHIDIKDFRLYFECLRKQNINWVETLFTDYMIVNPNYREVWDILVRERELIARYSPYAAATTTLGMAHGYYKCLRHPCEATKKYGYDPKKLAHLVRLYDFLAMYTKGERSYAECLRPPQKELIMAIKDHKYSLEVAEVNALRYLQNIIDIADDFRSKTHMHANPKAVMLLNSVQQDMMKFALRSE